MKEIYLIRHGDIGTQSYFMPMAQSNLISLNGEGREQAQRAAHFLADKKIELVAGSRIIRASETAQIIGEQLEVPVETWPYFHEIEVGDFHLFKKLGESGFADKLPKSVLRALFMSSVYGYFGLWFAGRANSPESPAQLRTRIVRAFEKIEFAAPERIAIVSHGYFISSLIISLVHRTESDYFLKHARWVENCSVTRLVEGPQGLKLDYFAERV
jgi:broad specificity phosphatase PhoE